MEELKAYLERLGFAPELIGGNCPFQIEANHRTGFSIYFRARGDIASLEIYDCGYTHFDGLPSEDSVLWEGCFTNWEWPDAGWITPETATYVFNQLYSDGKDFAFC